MIWPLIKKYWKYALIILGGIGAILLWIMISSWWKKNSANDNAGMTRGTETMKDVITEIGSKMTEANQQASVEIAVARGEENVKKEELKEVVKIKDKGERRRRMAEMYKTTQGG